MPAELLAVFSKLTDQIRVEVAGKIARNAVPGAARLDSSVTRRDRRPSKLRRRH